MKLALALMVLTSFLAAASASHQLGGGRPQIGPGVLNCASCSPPVHHSGLYEVGPYPTLQAAMEAEANFSALNTIKEMMADLGRPRSDLYEVALWEDMLTVQGSELFYAYMVDNQAIVIPETIDAIRALTSVVREANESIAMTNVALGIGPALVGPIVSAPPMRR